MDEPTGTRPPASPFEWQTRWAQMLTTYGSRAAGLTQEAAAGLTEAQQRLGQLGADFVEWQARWAQLMDDFVKWQAQWSELVEEFNAWQARWRDVEGGFTSAQARWAELGQEFTDELAGLQREAFAFPVEWQRQVQRWLAPFVGSDDSTD